MSSAIFAETSVNTQIQRDSHLNGEVTQTTWTCLKMIFRSTSTSHSTSHLILWANKLKSPFVIKRINCVPKVKDEIKFLREAACRNLRDEISNITIRNELKVFDATEKIADRKQNTLHDEPMPSSQTVTPYEQRNRTPLIWKQRRGWEK